MLRARGWSNVLDDTRIKYASHKYVFDDFKDITCFSSMPLETPIF